MGIGRVRKATYLSTPRTHQTDLRNERKRNLADEHKKLVADAARVSGPVTPGHVLARLRSGHPILSALIPSNDRCSPCKCTGCNRAVFLIWSDNQLSPLEFASHGVHTQLHRCKS